MVERHKPAMPFAYARQFLGISDIGTSPRSLNFPTRERKFFWRRDGREVASGILGHETGYIIIKATKTYRETRFGPHDATELVKYGLSYGFESGECPTIDVDDWAYAMRELVAD